MRFDELTPGRMAVIRTAMRGSGIPEARIDKITGILKKLKASGEKHFPTESQWRRYDGIGALTLVRMHKAGIVTPPPVNTFSDSLPARARHLLCRLKQPVTPENVARLVDDGTLTGDGTIQNYGRCTHAKVLKAIGRPVTERAVRRWKFNPFTGKPL